MRLPPLGRVRRSLPSRGLVASGRFRVLRGSACSGSSRCLVGDERRRVVSRAGAPITVSSRSGRDAVKEVGAHSCVVAVGSASCIDTEGVVPGVRRRYPDDGWAVGRALGGAARRPRRGGARRESVESCARCTAASEPHVGSTSRRCMQDHVDGVGGVVACRAREGRCRHARAGRNRTVGAPRAYVPFFRRSGGARVDFALRDGCHAWCRFAEPWRAFGTSCGLAGCATLQGRPARDAA